MRAPILLFALRPAQSRSLRSMRKIHTIGIRPAFVDGLQNALMAGAVVAAVGAVVALVLIRPERQAARAAAGQVAVEAA